MPQALLFSLLLTVVVVVGIAWVLRGALHPTSEEVDPDEPVVVGGPGAELQIEMLRSKLDALGIDAFTRNRMGRILEGFPANFAGWEVLVRNSDADEARAILADEPIGDETPA
jgi:hypothetical protein